MISNPIKSLTPMMVIVLLMSTISSVFAAPLIQDEVAPSVTVSEQSIVSSTVTIDEVVSPGQGWIVIHIDADGAPGPVIGQSQVVTGTNANVAVTIDEEKATETLYAMLHVDAGEIGTYEFPGADKPVLVDDKPVTPPFQIVKAETAATEEKEETATAGETIVDVATADGRFVTLVTALEAAELVDTLASEGPFTVFAPTDQAFAALPEGTLDDLLADVPALTDVLLYHVVSGTVVATDVVTLEAATTLQGEEAPITVDGDTVKIGEATVIVTDLEASNGIIHVIDTVLMPPTAGEESATAEADTTETSDEEATTTEAADSETADSAAATESTEGGVCAQDYTIQGGDTLSSVAAQFEGVSYTDIVDITNAVAQSDPNYIAITNPDTLNVGQVVCVSASGELTVVPSSTQGASAEAPAEAAIAAAETTEEEAITATDPAMDGKKKLDGVDVPEGKSAVLFENLSPVDLVVDLTPTSETVVVPPTGKQVFIVGGGSYALNVHQPGGGLAFEPATFEMGAGQLAEYIAFDGAFQLTIFDDIAVMAKPMATEPDSTPAADGNTIVDIAVGDDRFETLVAALQAAELVETLQTAGPYTVFAPTDEAFADLPEGTLEGLLADIPALTDVLLYHVVAGAVPAADVVTLDAATTLQGSDVAIAVDADTSTVTVNEATVVQTDIEASNGIIHVVSAVLIPPAPAAEETATSTEETAPATEETAPAAEGTPATEDTASATEETAPAAEETSTVDNTLAPPPGRSRIYLQNLFVEEVLLDIGGTPIKAAPGALEFADLDPGDYTYTISIPGGAASGELPMGADQSFLIRVNEDGGVGSGQVYPTQ